MDWQEALSGLSISESGRREAEEPMATEIVVGFMKSAIYPQIKQAQEELIQGGLVATVTPASVEDVSSESNLIRLSASNQPNEMLFQCSFEIQRGTGFDMHIQLDRRRGDRNLIVFVLDREGISDSESPLSIVESYLRDFQQDVVR